MWRALRIGAFVIVVVTGLASIMLATLRATVLDRGFYTTAFDDARAFHRLYDEVLPDPQLSAVSRDLTARLPLSLDQLTANLPLVLPPATLRGSVDHQVDSVIRYMRGERSDIDLRMALQPVIDRMHELADTHLADLITTTREVIARNLNDWSRRYEQVVTALRQGRKPSTLPTIPLTPRLAKPVAAALLQPLEPGLRARLKTEVEMLLRDGDLNGAIALVGPYLHLRVELDSGQDLMLRAKGVQFDAARPLASVGNQPFVRTLRTARGFISLGLGPGRLAAAALFAAALATLALCTRRLGGRAVRLVGGTLLATAAVAAVVGVVLRLVLGNPADPLLRPTSALPPAGRRLVADITGNMFAELDGEYLRAVAATVVVGLVVLAAAMAPAWWRRRHGLTAIGSRLAQRRTALVAGTAAVLAVGIAVPVLDLAFATPVSAAARVCNGHPELCQRTYDQVTVVATHNSMASTQDLFLGALQDPNVIGQLDFGARGLLIDTHYWEKDLSQALRQVKIEFPPQLAGALQTFLSKSFPARPGSWLCHAACRLGATLLTDQLRDLRGWLDRNPDEVITLVIQDAISPADTARAFTDAGLDDYLYRPGPDPTAPWPTLAEMIDSGRRLVVFAEQADGPQPWYRNFYRYAVETPFAFRSPQALSCTPNRGGSGNGKRLFLLNQFVTVGSGSRSAAGVINQRAFIVDRARACQRERGQKPTFVAVDYATIGDATAAADDMNGVSTEPQ